MIHPPHRTRRHLAGAAAAAALLPAPCLAAAADEPRVRLALRPEVEVTGPEVRLGDVAAIETLDLVLLERLMALPVGPAPRTGSTARLARGPLLRWIRAGTGLRAERFAWTGADEVVLRVSARTIEGAAVTKVATEALADLVAQDGLTAEIEATREPADVEVPAGVVDLRAHAVPRVALLSGRASVWVDVRVGGRLIRAVPVTFDLRATPTPSSSEPSLRRDNLGVAPVAEPGSPLVKKGSWATLRSGAGLLLLETRVRALEDGLSGQEIHVRSAGAEGPVLARVSGPGALEVVP